MCRGTPGLCSVSIHRKIKFKFKLHSFWSVLFILSSILALVTITPLCLFVTSAPKQNFKGVVTTMSVDPQPGAGMEGSVKSKGLAWNLAAQNSLKLQGTPDHPPKKIILWSNIRHLVATRCRCYKNLEQVTIPGYMLLTLAVPGESAVLRRRRTWLVHLSHLAARRMPAKSIQIETAM